MLSRAKTAARQVLRIWLLPLSVLLGAALAVFLLSFWVDASQAKSPARIFGLLFDPNPEAAANTLSNAAEVVAAILAIAITVVAIVVELAANRYTHRITELFVSSLVNFVVMGFFVVTALTCLFVTLTFDIAGDAATGFVPLTGVRVAMVMLTLCLLILLPYFAFVFAFLSPIQIVDRIRAHTMDMIDGRTGVGAKKREAVRGIEQLSDVGLNAMEHKDKAVSMASVDALGSMLRQYQNMRANLPREWFRVDGELAHNPDFVSMAQDVLDKVTARRVWFEMKVLRQYQTLYNEALNRMRDINYVVAIETRMLAELALERDNEELLTVTIRFFNTYLRATINGRDVRTAYNVLKQYRALAEYMLSHGRPDRAIEIARHFKYYGLISFHAKQPFVLETAAYDLCALNEMAFDLDSPSTNDLLRVFLEVDKESESEVQERSLRGVRKAQIKLATYYLLKGNESLAQRVYRDMASEQPERLASIRDELMSVRSPEFWEISDRGVNFDYLSEERKAKLLVFFGWFGDKLPVARPSTIPPEPDAPSAHRPTRRTPDPDLPGVDTEQPA